LNVIEIQLSDSVFIDANIGLKRSILHKLKAMKDTGFVCNDIDMTLLNVEENHELGHGAFGHVYSGTYSGNSVAIKSLIHIDDAGLAELKSEVSFMRALSQYPGIVRLYGANFNRDKGDLCLVLDKANGTLHDAIHMGNLMQLDLSLPMKLYAITSIAHAMEFVAEAGIVHRDVKPMNVLVFMPSTNALSYSSTANDAVLKSLSSASADSFFINENCASPAQLAPASFSAIPQFKLTDFGLAKRGAESKGKASSTLKGTPHYMAPELFTATVGHARFGMKTDVFAFGISMNEVLTMEVPFEGLDQMQIMHAVVSRGKRPRKYEPSSPTDTVGNAVRSVIDSCLETDPTERPTFRELAAYLRTLCLMAVGEIKSRIASSISSSSSLDFYKEDACDDTNTVNCIPPPTTPSLSSTTMIDDSTTSETERTTTATVAVAAVAAVATASTSPATTVIDSSLPAPPAPAPAILSAATTSRLRSPLLFVT
jgi:serine/threonine protein kinase